MPTNDGPRAATIRPMIDLKKLRENPDRFRDGARLKKMSVDIDRLVAIDEEHRTTLSEMEALKAEQNKLAKETGPAIGKLSGQLKKAEGDERAALEREIETLKAKPQALKEQIAVLDAKVGELKVSLDEIALEVPQPPDADVPVGESADDNIERSTWHPEWFDPSKSFQENKGFAPKSHQQIINDLGLVDFERGVKIAGSRSYLLLGDGMRLHQAVLRYAMDTITEHHGFTPISVPVIVREECMVGTGFFPHGREQTYVIDEHARGSEHDLYLTGTGEVGLMGYRSGEILDESELPLKYATVSTCFRREAGAAGRDGAGLYRIHQFEKVEQVIICKADEAESRKWHAEMIGIVVDLLKSLELPHRQLQCCTADLGPKNADMIDLECWMPSRGELDASGIPTGAYGETHSASRLYDFQCRRLGLRYRPTGEKQTVYCHSLNNTVLASPRFLIPIIEMYQNEDGTITVPTVLRPYMNGRETIG